MTAPGEQTRCACAVPERRGRIGPPPGDAWAGLQNIAGETRDRTGALLHAIMSVSSGLDLDATLRRVVRAALALVDARYGTLGLPNHGGMLTRFIPVGIDEDTRKLIGPLPSGQGVSTSPRPGNDHDDDSHWSLDMPSMSRRCLAVPTPCAALFTADSPKARP